MGQGWSTPSGAPPPSSNAYCKLDNFAMARPANSPLTPVKWCR